MLPNSILNDSAICEALKQAWEDSQPGIIGGHEEGGFVVRDTQGNLSVTRWPIGQQNVIFVPAHTGCKIGGLDIRATFHTHPNTGTGFLQEPSDTDKRAVRDDPDLKGPGYEGEYVIALQKVYHIAPDGQVSEVGNRLDLLGG